MLNAELLFQNQGSFPHASSLAFLTQVTRYLTAVKVKKIYRL